MSITRPILQPILQPILSSPFEAMRKGSEGGGGAWSPTRLFAASEVGIMFIPEAGRCWQDTDRTIPAVPGDPIAALDDNSGNDNCWLLSGATLREDSLGVWYVEHAGSGSVHRTRDNVPLSDPHLAVWVGSASADGAAYVLLDTFVAAAGPTGSASILSGFNLGSADPTAATFGYRGSGSLVRYVASPVNPLAATCASLRADQTKATAGAAINARFGATPITISNPNSNVGAGTWAVGQWGLGARNNSGNRFKGAIYCIIARNAETDDDTYDAAREWVTTRMAGYVPAAPPISEGQTVDVLLVAGQSNAAGRGVAADSPTVLQDAGAWWNGNDYIQLRDPVGGAATGSAWPAFANAYFAATERSVLVVSSARGGSGLLPGVGTSDWSPSGANRALAVTAANAAIAYVDADPDRTLGNVYVAWQQGEQDGSEYNGTTVTDTLYQAAQEELFDYFFDNIDGLDAILVSELGQRTTPNPNYVLIRDAQNAAVAATENVHLAFDGAKNFPAQGKMIDAVHYNQTGLNEMGAAMGGFAATLVEA